VCYVASAGVEGVGRRMKIMLWVPPFCVPCKERCGNFVCDCIETDEGWKDEVEYEASMSVLRHLGLTDYPLETILSLCEA
jgi:hypothetical protein